MRFRRIPMVRKHLVHLACAGLLVAAAPYAARGSVLATGDVIPADNPFTLNDNEGLPIDGNFVNPFEPVDEQTFFEGRHRDNNLVDPNDDDNINANVFVGRSASGTLLISGESALRYMNLVIGDRGTLPNGQMRNGTGVVRITGFGSLYNNDFNILPPGLPANFSSVNPRETEGSIDGLDGADQGFDLYVGRWGTGTLEISAGGRAEIHDAVIVGDNPGAVGSIIVDGFDSFLGSGGFETGGLGAIRQMLVGRFGIGFMTVSTGGTVVSEAPPASVGGGTVGPIGAAIGSEPSVDTSRPEEGGQGTVTVTGIASKWIVGGSLQIGGFHNSQQEIGAGGGEDIEGDDVEYRNEVGRGTLRVYDGGLVSVRPAIDADEQVELLLSIGRFGRLELSGGVVAVGGSLTTAGTVSDQVKLINDGVISGSGRIGTGIFRNRYHGEVRVRAGQSLIIDAASESQSGATLEQEPLLNFGVIQVFGTQDARAELEFERGPNTDLQPLRPFLNLRVDRPAAAPLTDFYGGLISAQHSILRFRSGILNEGMMAFTAGNNYVTGTVINMPGPDPAMPLVDPGIMVFSGPDTKVTFENDFFDLGTTFISGGAVVEVLARHSYITAGNLNIQLSPTDSSKIVVAGDAGISGRLTVSLSGFGPGSLSIGDTFEIISVGGQLGGVDLSDPLRPRVDLAAPPLFTNVITPSLAFLGLPPTAVLLPIYTPNSVLLSIMSLGAAVGPDFNGDGIVDHLDLAIWQANVGITMGATVLQGDADGDGDVDGDDFLFWQRNVGQPPPWSGSGSASNGGLSGQVPEPATLALLSIGGLLALAQRRRRAG